MLEAVATDLDRDRQAQTRLDMALAGAPPPNLAVLTMGFLHGLVPVILVSITDAITAIIVSILALIWALFMLIGSLIAVIRALRVDRV